MTEYSLSENTQRINQLPNLKEESEQQDEFQCSTEASNLNNSVDNLSTNNKISELDIIDPAQLKRKYSAPISQIIGLNITKLGKGPKSSYFNKLFCKGLLC